MAQASCLGTVRSSFIVQVFYQFRLGVELTREGTRSLVSFVDGSTDGVDFIDVATGQFPWGPNEPIRPILSGEKRCAT